MRKCVICFLFVKSIPKPTFNVIFAYFIQLIAAQPGLIPVAVKIWLKIGPQCGNFSMKKTTLKFPIYFTTERFKDHFFK